MTGHYGRWTVLSFSHIGNWREAYWNCRCDCGVVRPVAGKHLKSGKSKSCGCLNRELCAKRIGDRLRTHGLTKTPTFVSWTSMLSRCENPNRSAYPRYGGAGILVCPRWHSFTAFLEDMGKRPTDKTLGRLMDLGNYEPGNVFWMTKKEQTQAQIDRRKWKNLNALIADIVI